MSASEKHYRIPPHTAQNLHDREIPFEEVALTIEHPESVVPGYDQRTVYMRRYHDKILDQEMLLRVVVEETPAEFVVVTVYKTSQVGRYLKGK